MKRVLIMIAVAMLLVGCSGNKKSVTAEVEEKRSEMTELAAIHYLNQVTHRFIQATGMEMGSFEQTSELQAAIARSETIIEEIQTEYVEGLPLALAIIDIAEQSKSMAERALEGNDNMIGGVYVLEAEVTELANEHLDGELPPTIKFLGF